MIGDYNHRRYVAKHVRHRPDYESEFDDALNAFFKYVALFMGITFVFWSIANVVVPIITAVAGLLSGSER